MLETPLFDPSVNEAVRGTVPDPLRPIVEAATHLGDPATLLAVAVAYYWYDGGTRGARVLGVALVAFAVTNGLKGLFVIERPVEHLAFTPDDYGGYGLPSGHALGAAAVYGFLAAVADRDTAGRRYVLAGTLIGLVALSRLVLGVHYAGDVVAGTALGLAIGLGLAAASAPDPGRLFVVAGALAIVSYATPSRAFMPATVGAALAATGSWYVLETRTVRDGFGYLAVGLAVLLVLGLRVLSAAWGVHWSVELGGYALAVGAVLAIAPDAIASAE